MPPNGPISIWPARFDPAMQPSDLLYALLVTPLIALPHTGAADGLLALERPRQRLNDAADAGARPAGLRVGVSAGVTELGPDEALERAIERADQAMYRAKTSGRSRCLPA